MASFPPIGGPVPPRPEWEDLRWRDILSGFHMPQGGGGGLGGALSRIGTGLINAPSYALEDKQRDYELELERLRAKEKEDRDRQEREAILERQGRLDAEAKRRSDAQLALNELHQEQARLGIKRSRNEDSERAAEEAHRAEIAALHESDPEAAQKAAGVHGFVTRGDRSGLAYGVKPQYRMPVPGYRLVEAKNPDGSYLQFLPPRDVDPKDEGVTSLRTISTGDGSFSIVVDQNNQFRGIPKQDIGSKPHLELISKKDTEAAKAMADLIVIADLKTAIKSGEIKGSSIKELDALVATGMHTQWDEYEKRIEEAVRNNFRNLDIVAETAYNAFHGNPEPRGSDQPTMIDPAAGESGASSAFSRIPEPKKITPVDVDKEIETMARGDRRTIAQIKREVQDLAAAQEITEEEAWLRYQGSVTIP